MIDAILAHFDLPSGPLRAARYGSGLINDTWLCVVPAPGGELRYILQRINGAVFNRPDQVMENIEAVTAHMLARLRREGVERPESATPVLARTKDGRSHHADAAGGCWRMFHFIEEGTVHDRVQGEDHAYEVGRGLGRFQALVADLDPAVLHDTLPGFHHTPRFVAELEDAVRHGRADRAAAARRELEHAERRRDLAPLLTALRESGRVPLRVVHNDPKVNNVLVHRRTGRAICMIDLDTVKPGIVHFDFGDCVRSAANPAGEDAEPERVDFDRACYAAIREGYLEETASFLTSAERDTLAVAVRVITYELGIRFLADHLRGDTYFRTRHPGHNLLRARVQFRLLECMELAGI